MGGNGKKIWKISFRRSSSTSRTNESDQPPAEFICLISGCLMADPVVVSTGQSFERVAVQACRNLGFNPVLEDGSEPDFTAVIPNLAMKTTILSWCDKAGVDHPRAPDYTSVQEIVRTKMEMSGSSRSSEIHRRVSDRELLNGVADNPPLMFTHAVTELGHQMKHFPSSSSEEWVTAAVSLATPLPLTTQPACYSASPFSDSEIMENDIQFRNPTKNPNPNPSCPEEEDFVTKLTKSDLFEQEKAVISLRKITRTREEIRALLCTEKLLSALRSLMTSRYAVVQTNAVAALLNLSLEKSNKLKIVGSGLVPTLIELLKGGFNESQEHATGALFSLALEEKNKIPIAVLGALPPLMHALRSDSERTQHDAALALYQLTLVPSNRVKLVKLNAAATLVEMLKSRAVASAVVLILCNLAACAEGRAAMLDANAVESLVGMLRRGRGVDSEGTRENCVAALYALSQGSMRFKGLAVEARAVEVLREVEERGSKRAKEKAKRTLQILRERKEEVVVAQGVSWGSVLESGGFSRIRYSVAGGSGSNSSAF